MLTLSAQSVYENEVINTIMARRSIRKYHDKPVEHEKLEVIVKCGINAPSGVNHQPWVCLRGGTLPEPCKQGVQMEVSGSLDRGFEFLAAAEIFFSES